MPFPIQKDLSSPISLSPSFKDVDKSYIRLYKRQGKRCSSHTSGDDFPGDYPRLHRSLYRTPSISRFSLGLPTSFLALKKFSVCQHRILAPSSSNMPLPRSMLRLSLVALISFSTQARPSTSLSPLEPRNNKFWLHCGNAPTVIAGE